MYLTQKPYTLARYKPGTRITLIFCALLACFYGHAHTINYALEKAPVHEVAAYYFKLGFLHIVPQGLDHILFVVGLCLLSNNIKAIILQATAFTIAHSLTLALSLKNIVVAPSAIVEPIIALSIVFIAAENLILKKLMPWRLILVFFFGLIHGLGFASSLNEIGLPRNKFFTSVVTFNAGVEVGQIAIIVLVYFLLIRPFSLHRNYRKWVVFPLSAIISAIALFWTIERIAEL